MSVTSISPTAKPKKDRKACTRTVKIAGKETSASSHTSIAHRRHFACNQPDIGKVADHVIAARYCKLYGFDVMTTKMVQSYRRGANIKADHDRYSTAPKPIKPLNWRSVLLEQSWRPKKTRMEKLMEILS